METPSHHAILKRTGIVLLGIGLLDIAFLVYCVANRESYSSSFNIVAVAAGIFLIRGSLRAASIVRWFSVFMLAAFVALVLAWPLLQPMALTLTHIRLSPVSALISLSFMAIILCLLYWLYRELGKAPVLQARASAGRMARDMRIPAAAGVAVVILLTFFLSFLLGGESAAKAKLMAAKELGAEYRYHVSSLNIVTNNQGKFVAGVVTAWNDKEIRNVPFRWEEH